MSSEGRIQNIWLFVFCFLASFLCFVTRVNISIAAPEMIAQGWTEAEMGIILSAFFWGYVIMQIPGGVLADRYGGKLIMSSGVFFFSLFTCLTPLSPKVWMMSIIRGLVGVGQGANFPCVTNLISRLAKPHHMARLQGFTLSGAHIGPLIALPAGAWIVGRYGWPSIFYVSGLIGFLWCILFVLKVGDIKTDDCVTRPRIPWKRLLTDKSSWGLTVSYFSHNYTAYFFLAWLPTYLIQAQGFSFMSMGIVASLPSLASFISMNLSGWFSDLLVRKGKSPAYSRLLLIYIGMGGSAISLMLITLCSSPFMAVFYITLASALRSISTPLYWTLTIDLAGDRAGILASIMNTSGNFAGILAPMISGFIVSYFADWNLAIYMCILAVLVGVLILIPTVGARHCA